MRWCRDSARAAPHEGAEEVRASLPRDRHRVAHDVARDVTGRVDIAEGVERELLPRWSEVVKAESSESPHPRVGQADQRRLVQARCSNRYVRSRETVGEGHAHVREAGGRDRFLPDGGSNHHETLG